MEKMTFKDKMFNWVKKNKIDLIVYFGFIIVLLTLITLAVAPQYKSAVINNKPYNPNMLTFSIGTGISVAWYAIFILMGIILAAFMAFLEFKKLGWDTEDLFDGILIIAPLSIIGARVYYVLFDKNTPFSDIYKIWEGGLAIHGAIIVATIGIIIFSRKKKLNVFAVADVLAIGFLIGQISGRWGNFMNAEAHGGPTNSPFLLKILPNFIEHQMKFSSYDFLGTGTIFQPTFLYESLWNFLGLTILLVVRRKKWFKVGDMLGFYLIWYGFGRGVLVEPFRTDQLMAFNETVPVNILLSLLLFVGGGVLLLILKRVYIKDEPYYADLAIHDVKLFNKKVKKEKIDDKSSTV